MHEVRLRKQCLLVETIHHEGGPALDTPVLRAACLAVIENPFAGRHEPELEPFMEALNPLGLEMSRRLVEALGGASRVQSYGKGAIVGEGGADSKAIVPSAMKLAGVGARLDVPIGHIDAAYVRSHFDAMEIGLADAPRRGELLLALVMTTGGRVHARMGGLRVEDVEGKDGLR